MAGKLRLGLATSILVLAQSASAQTADTATKLDSKGLFNPSTGQSIWLQWRGDGAEYGTMAYAPAYQPHQFPNHSPQGPPSAGPILPWRVPGNQIAFFNYTESKLTFSARFSGADRIIEMGAKEITSIPCGDCTGEMTASIRTGNDASTSKSTKLQGGKMYWLVQQSGLWDIVSK